MFADNRCPVFLITVMMMMMMMMMMMEYSEQLVVTLCAVVK